MLHVAYYVLIFFHRTLYLETTSLATRQQARRYHAVAINASPPPHSDAPINLQIVLTQSNMDPETLPPLPPLGH